MKPVLSLLLVAGALTLLPGLSATARQSSATTAQPQASTDPQAKTSSPAFSHNRHHTRHRNTAHAHRHHKTSAKH